MGWLCLSLDPSWNCGTLAYLSTHHTPTFSGWEWVVFSMAFSKLLPTEARCSNYWPCIPADMISLAWALCDRHKMAHKSLLRRSWRRDGRQRRPQGLQHHQCPQLGPSPPVLSPISHHSPSPAPQTAKLLLPLALAVMRSPQSATLRRAQGLKVR